MMEGKKDGAEEKEPWRNKTEAKKQRMTGQNDNHKKQNLLKKLNFSEAGEEGLPKSRNKVSYPSHPFHTTTGYPLFKKSNINNCEQR